jgi:protease PrsW
MNLRWLPLFIGGIILFAAVDLVLRLTQDLNFLPAMILLGALVVPVTLVVYFYDHVRDRDISIAWLTGSFIIGGAIGIVVAGLLEFSTLKSLNAPGLIFVGLAEESAKLIWPLVMFIMWRFRHEADGLLFGVAVGMGFAALETMGYGMTTIVQNHGNITSLEQVLILRGFLSPAGHAAWTGLVCAVLWRERQRAGRLAINYKVIGAFLLAVLLHFTWDLVNTVKISALAAFAGSAVVAGISLWLLIAQYRHARRNSPEPRLAPQ